MNRHALKDAEWAKIKRYLPVSFGRPPKLGTRNFIDDVIFLARTGISRRDLPERFGNSKAVCSRFRKWSLRGVWQNISDAILTSEQDQISLMDSSVVRVHQDGSGGRGGEKKRNRAFAKRLPVKNPFRRKLEGKADTSRP